MHDIIVIGGGPAGLTAALYAARAGKKVIVIEKAALGGQIVYSPMVDNYPALPHVSGMEFAEKLSAQVEALGVEIEYDEVLSLEKTENGFKANAYMGSFEAPAVIIAAGTKHRKLGVAGEDKLVGRGISYCAVCDGAFFKDKEVAVVGGGNTALQEAIFLSAMCKKVTLIHRRDSFRAEKQLVDAALLRENIEMKYSAVIESLEEENGKLSALNLSTGEKLAVDGLFVAIGQISESAPFVDFCKTDDAGFFLTDSDAVSVKGIFTAGDCRQKAVRQLTTAVGDGAEAGTAACEYLDTL